MSAAHSDIQAQTKRWRHVEIVNGDFTYEVLRNDPDGWYPRLLFTVAPISANAAANVALGGYVSAAYRYKNKLEFFAEYNQAYIDFTKDSELEMKPKMGRTVGNSTFPAQQMEGRTEFSLFSYNRRFLGDSVQVSGSYRLSYQVQVDDTKAIRKLNMRVGYGYRNGIAIASATTSQGFVGMDVVGEDPNPQVLAGEDLGDYMSMVGTQYAVVGFAFEFHNDVKVELESMTGDARQMARRYGLRNKPKYIRQKSRVMKIYSDVLISTGSRIANMTVYERTDRNSIVHTDDYTFRTYELNTHTPDVPVGFRIGFQVQRFGRGPLGVFYAWEFGIPPGKAQLNSTYFLLRAGFHLAAVRGRSVRHPAGASSDGAD